MSGRAGGPIAGVDALALAEQVLAVAGEEQAEVVVHAERSGLARFAASEIHQPTLIENATVQLRILRGAPGALQAGTASTNRLDEAGLASLVERAREAAANAGPDDTLPPLPAPATAPAVEGWDDATAALGGEEQARLALAAIDAASLPLYGFFTAGAVDLAVASTTGLRARQRSTDVTARIIAATEGASGFAERTAWAASRVDPAAAAREACAKAERTRGAAVPDPGIYRAVLEPYAVGELLQWLAYDSFSGLGLLDGASCLAGRLGQRVFDPKVSLHDDGLTSEGLPKAVDFEGVPRQRVAIVEEGVARGVVWDTGTAARARREGLGGGGSGDASIASTGHALPAASRAFGPFASAVTLAPGDAPSLEALAEAVGDGIHVTRLHYLSIVSPRDGIITGTTRDGTFRIRNGRIAEPLVNLRFTVSLPDLLGEVIGLTQARQLTGQSDFYDDRFAYAALVPALATARFAVTGTGSGPGL
jgi:PmbA protein